MNKKKLNLHLYIYISFQSILKYLKILLYIHKLKTLFGINFL